LVSWISPLEPPAPAPASSAQVRSTTYSFGSPFERQKAKAFDRSTDPVQVAFLASITHCVWFGVPHGMSWTYPSKTTPSIVTLPIGT
jgi:hypothetical protein